MVAPFSEMKAVNCEISEERFGRISVQTVERMFPITGTILLATFPKEVIKLFNAA